MTLQQNVYLEDNCIRNYHFLGGIYRRIYCRKVSLWRRMSGGQNMISDSISNAIPP